MFENKEICAACKGRCCEMMPGACFPEDFSWDSLEDALKSGKYCIDWWEGDPRPKGRLEQAYFIRPATKGKEGILLDASWGGECVFLEKGVGCMLSCDKRPLGCQMLEPIKGGCNVHGKGKKESCIAWIEHRKVIKKLIDKLD
jgi:hypothetical protein